MDPGGLKDFFYRRFLRIFPSLISSVIFFSTIFSFYLLPEKHDFYFKTALTSLFGASNIFLGLNAHSYFAPSEQLNPFLPLWSISLEDQFYFSFALMLFFLCKLKHDYRIFIAIIVFITSLFLGTVFSPTENIEFFYMPFSRYWEFFIGAAAYYYCSQGIKFHRLITLLKIPSLAIIILYFIYADSGKIGYYQLLGFCLCSSIILIETRISNPNNDIINKLLSFKYLRLIGLISFSLYLFHFPILKLIEYYRDIEAGNFLSFAIYITGVLLLSTINYLFIESRFVNHYRARKSPIKIHQLKILSIIALTSFVIIANSFLTTINSQTAVFSDQIKAASGGFNIAENNNTNMDLLLLGDSHSQMLYPMFHELELKHSINIIDKTGSACLIGHEISYSHNGKVEQRCKKHISETLNSLKFETKKKLVFLGMRSLAYLSNYQISQDDRPVDWINFNGKYVKNEHNSLVKAYVEHLNTILTGFEKSNVHFIFLAPIPEMKVPTFKCLINNQKNECRISQSINLAYREMFMAELKKLALIHQNFKIWDPFYLICPKGECRNIIGNNIIFRDDDHLSIEMAKSLAPNFIEFLTNENLIY